ncbi:uncharacterized protein LOC117832662 [Notolabrus celidotus]|uniref:uncharacterized protein LOC117813187 n=1 Tax=Notolabrus celidotus TaxID=1203425 RepID=UPI00149022A8|nr:uncharacterized protein LOC117813187 [Notolabrus celidotus]XP_034567781.1 uncharacterized protein LOC117832662 [Notolabrus celidotus]
MAEVGSADVITHLKSIFARHGIPEVMMSDNGPQFSGQVFASFAALYGFKHVTSSPRFPQSNGEAERAVQTVKSLLKKAADPYLALLAYRATPLQNGYSPAQLLMGRRLRTTVPSLSSQLDPALPDGCTLVRQEREKRMLDAENYNRRHRTKTLRDLTPGEHVWVTDVKSSGTVIKNHSTPRSYLVDLPQGVVRRNRLHLIPEQTPTQDKSAPQQQVPGPVPEQAPMSPAVASPVSPTETNTLRTRSGRAVVKPTRLNL